MKTLEQIEEDKIEESELFQKREILKDEVFNLYIYKCHELADSGDLEYDDKRELLRLLGATDDDIFRNLGDKFQIAEELFEENQSILALMRKEELRASIKRFSAVNPTEPTVKVYAEDLISPSNLAFGDYSK